MKEVTAKKSKLWLWLTLGAVALLVVAAAVLLLMPGQSEAPEGTPADYEIWWNLDRESFTANAIAGLSDREPDSDGVYRIRFAGNGTIKEFTTVDKKLVNLIDAMDVAALALNGQEILDAQKPADLGYVVRDGVYVQSVSSGTVTCNSSVALNGMPIRVRISEALQVLDVRADAAQQGQDITPKGLEALDYVYTVADAEGKFTHVFLAGRSPKSSVYWRASQQYSSANKETTRVPDENGVYTLDFFCDGQLVELKCKDKAIVNKVDSANRFTCHFAFEFDEEGYIIKNKLSSLGIKGMIGCSNYVVTSLQEGVVTAVSMTGSEMGNEFAADIDQYCMVYDVSKTAKSEGRQGQQVESLQVGDHIVLWTDVEGVPVLAYVTLRLTDTPAYFNMERKWSSYSKQSLREPDSNGWYYVDLLKEGDSKPKTYKTKDKALVDAIDSRADQTVGICADGGVLTTVYEAECIFGYTNQGPRYVVNADGMVYSAMTYKTPSDVINGVIGADCKIYDVSGTGPLGAETQLRQGDLIIIHRNEKLETVRIYVTRRTMGVKHAYYNLNRQYDSQKKVTTRVPDENGYYVFEMANQGKIVTVKTKSKELATKMDAFTPPAMGLTVKNGVVQYVYNPIQIAGAVRVAYYSYVKSIAADGTVTAETSTGITSTFKPAKNCTYYNCSQIYTTNRGEKVSGIKVGDLITGYMSQYAEATVVFILSRDTGNIAWNTQRKYNSTTQQTTRVPDADGWYVYELLVGNQLKTVKTKDQALASKVDSYEGAFGLLLKDDVICSAQGVGLVKGVESGGVNGWDVIAMDGSKITLCYTKPGSADYTGQTREATLSKNLKVYDISPSAEVYGQEVQLQLGDRVRTYVDEKEKVVYAYVLYHATRTAGTEGYCDHCKQNVHWEPWNGGSFAKADRHYYLNCDVTKGVAATLATRNTTAYETVIDLNGKTITIGGSRFVTVNAGQTLTMLDSVGGGTVNTSAGASNGGVFSVQAGATLKLLGGAYHGIVGDDNKGSVAYVVAGGTLNISGGVLDGSGMTYGKGAGGTIYSSGDVIITGGEIKGASAGSGGSIYMNSGNLTISGGKISGGQAANYGDEIFVNNAASVVTISGGEIGGQVQLSQVKSVTLSGAPKIGELKLANSMKIALGQMTTGAQIAVAGSGAFTNTLDNAESYQTYFTAADSANYYVLAVDGALSLVDKVAYSADCVHCGKKVLWYPWRAANTESGHYFLDKDQNRTVHFTSQAADMVIDLHGQTFTATNARAMMINSGITVSILDSVGGGTIITSTPESGGVFSVKGGGTLNFYSGTAKTTSAVNTQQGSIAYVMADGTLNLYGGVLDASAVQLGKGACGAIYSSGAVNISGGEVKGASAGSGGSIYVNAGSLNISGGKISGGQAANYGDDIFVSNAAAIVSFSGGEVAGQIQISSAATVTVYGAPKLSNLKLGTTVKLTLGELKSAARIAVEASGEFSLPSSKAKQYLEAGNIFALDTTKSVEVTTDGVLYILEAAAPKCPHCDVAMSDINWQAWNAATAIGTSGHYYLTADVNRTLQFVPTAADLVIDLRGFNFVCTKASTRTFLVNSGITLTVMDTVASGTVSGLRTSNGSAYNVQAGGTLNLYGGTAIAAYAATNGSVVYVQAGGTLNIGGTAVVDGSAVTTGSGTRSTIYSEGTVNITGGEVKGASAGSGGSIYVNAGSLNISGGKISGGQAANYGDDIFVSNAESVVTISGGEVAGQFQISSAAAVTVSGAPKLLNLKLGSAVQLTLGQLEAGTQIAVAALGAFTKESANAKVYLDAGYFTCATAGKTIYEENDILMIE